MDISAQVRQVNVLRTLATQGVQDPNGMFAFAIAKLEARWKEVHAIFNSTTAQAAYVAVPCDDGGGVCCARTLVR